jgi:hypothetical protein
VGKEVWEKHFEELLYGKRVDKTTVGNEKGMSNNVRIEEDCELLVCWIWRLL